MTAVPITCAGKMGPRGEQIAACPLGAHPLKMDGAESALGAAVGFRCYYCRRVFCATCALHHFGEPYRVSARTCVHRPNDPAARRTRYRRAAVRRLFALVEAPGVARILTVPLWDRNREDRAERTRALKCELVVLLGGEFCEFDKDTCEDCGYEKPGRDLVFHDRMYEYPDEGAYRCVDCFLAHRLHAPFTKSMEDRARREMDAISDTRGNAL